MKDFADKEQLFEYLADLRIVCSKRWDLDGQGSFDWYVFPDYDEDEDEFIKQGSLWQNPLPAGNKRAIFPQKLGFDCEGNILFLENFSINGIASTPVAVFDAFDEKNMPCTFAMFGQGDTSIRTPEERYKLLCWHFEGFDDEDEPDWEHMCAV